jgi:hypothetical protein
VNLFVLLTSLVFVAAGAWILSTGRDPTTGLMTVLFFGGCALVAAWDLLERWRERREAAQAFPVEPAPGRDEVIIKPRRAEALVYFLASAGFTAGGVCMILLEGPQAIGWVGVAFFGPGALVFLWQLLDVRPRLVITGRGVYDRTNGAGWIPWSDIRYAWLQSVMGHEFVCLEVHDPDRYLSRMSRWRRLVGKLNRGAGYSELWLNLSGLAVSIDQVFRVIEHHLRAARATAGYPLPGDASAGAGAER